MQDIIRLFRNTNYYNYLRDKDLIHYLNPSINLNQYKKHYNYDELIGFTNWAYLSNQAYNNFTQTGKINYKEWNSGSNLVFVQFIAIKNIRKIFKWCINMARKFKGVKDNFTWLRVENNKIKRVIIKDL